MGKCATHSPRDIHKGMPFTTTFRKGFTQKGYDFELYVPEFSERPVHFLNKNCRKDEIAFGSLAIYIANADP